MCYPDETKAAVMAALLAGQSVSSVARAYKLPKGTVSSWKKRGREISTQKKQIGDKLLELVSIALDGAIARERVFGDPDWIRKQTAAEVATLHGICSDKTIRLLEAFQAAGEDTPD